MALSEYYVDPAGGNDTTGDGTIGTPWKSVQKAFDSITRNATDGDRVNVKAGGADTLSAALSLTTYGAPSTGAPLIVQGYTAAAGDGGIGELSGGGTVGIASAAKQYLWFADMKLGNCGSQDVLDLGYDAQIIHCEIYGSSGFGIDPDTALRVVGCWFHDLTGTYAIDNCNYQQILYNYFDVATTTGVLLSGASANIAFNIIKHATDTSANGVTTGNLAAILNNVFYTSAANTGSAMLPGPHSLVLNNITEGWSGAGGKGISTASGIYLGANAYYNTATNESLSAVKWFYSFSALTALGASPFTDKANGDFSLTAAAKTALAAKGWPTAYLGAHANTVPNLNIGPIQLAASAGGGGRPAFGDRTGGKF